MCVECVLAVLWDVNSSHVTGQTTNWTCTALIGCELVQDRWRFTGNNTQLTVSANEDEINYSDYLIKAQFAQMTKDSQSHFSLRQPVYFCTQHPLPYIDNLNTLLDLIIRSIILIFCSVFFLFCTACTGSFAVLFLAITISDLIWLLKWDCTAQQHRSYSFAFMCPVIKLL